MRGLTDEEFEVLSFACSPHDLREPTAEEVEVLIRLQLRGLFDHERWLDRRGYYQERWLVNELGRLALRVETAFRSAPRLW